MKPDRGPGKFVFIKLQKRLLSSIEAFHRTLEAHISRLESRFGSDVLSEDFVWKGSQGAVDEPANDVAAPSSGKLELELTEADKKQLRDEREHMKKRLAAMDKELQSEPEELRAFYRVAPNRLEPVGLVYLWPSGRL